MATTTVAKSSGVTAPAANTYSEPLSTVVANSAASSPTNKSVGNESVIGEPNGGQPATNASLATPVPTLATASGGGVSTPTSTSALPTKLGGGGNVTSTAPSLASAQTVSTTGTQQVMTNNSAGTPVKIPTNAQASALEAEYGINNKVLNQNGYTLQIVGSTPVLTKNLNGTNVVYTINGLPVGELVQLGGGVSVLESLPNGINFNGLPGPLVEEISSVNAVRNQG